ncbi:MAG: asparagine synthase (glutamine-hydrolyzing) [Acidobacteriota bacterium]
MCGICGIVATEHSGRQINENLLVRMRDSLTHRGPDEAGLYLDGNIGLGHRRLSIVDLSGGKQPMTNEDRTIFLSYNGEIYNHREVRKGLIKRGHHYATSSDSETLVHLYEERGRHLVEELRGMFAFAIWDSNRKTLLLARDRLGIKPLYYHLRNDGTLYFASEIKALLEARATRPALNYAVLADFAANRSPSGEETLFSGIKRLLPGHTLSWQNGGIDIEPYWNVSFAKTPERLSEKIYLAQFNELFEEAVRLRLMADVPLGAFLSGGIDSSAIVEVMSRSVTEPIKTFSVAFAEREANELEYARLIARTFKTDHHEIIVHPQQFFDALPTLIYQEDEPIAHPSSLPLYFVSKLASEQVKVVLTGEGSDELLAGYGKYRNTIYNLKLGRNYHQRVPQSIKRQIHQAIKQLPNTSPVKQKLTRTFLCLAPDLEEIYFDNFSVFSRHQQSSLFTSQTIERMTEYNPYRDSLDYGKHSDAETLLDKLLAIDMKTYLQELLMKQDQMSMAASIESRVPFLDHKLVEFAARLPVNMKLRGRTTKYILREAMRGRLPKAILSRRKMGFPVPVGSWLRHSFTHILDEYVTGERAIARGIFNRDYVKALVNRHLDGERHDERLWMLINFEIWQRQFFDGEYQNQSIELDDLPVSIFNQAKSASPPGIGR